MAREDKDRLIDELRERVLELTEYSAQVKDERDIAQKALRESNERIAELELELMGKERMLDEEGEEIDFDSLTGGLHW